MLRFTLCHTKELNTHVFCLQHKFVSRAISRRINSIPQSRNKGFRVFIVSCVSGLITILIRQRISHISQSYLREPLKIADKINPGNPGKCPNILITYSG